MKIAGYGFVSYSNFSKGKVMSLVKIFLAVCVSLVLAACGGGGGGGGTVPVVTPTAPSAPTIGAATAGNAQATVAFSSPASNGGSAITSYTVTSSPGNKTATGTSSPLVVTGLTNGTAYSFTVTATNSVGTSPASTASNAVTPVAPVVTPTPAPTVPSAPIMGSATAGNGQATIVFAAPASNGGSAITSYTATSNAGQFATSTATSITVTGLTNGTAYTFTVKATNAVGNSAASAASNSVTPAVPATAPGAPTAVVATAGAAGTSTASVTFVAPASTGGSAITGYTVTSVPAGGVDANAGSTALTHSITGLTIGTAYTFTVKASNAVGAGTASVASAAITPLAALPTAPASATAVAGNAAATVNCATPSSNGGAAITSYTAVSTPGNFTASSPTCSMSVTGLTNGTSYTFAVHANNSAGAGLATTTNAVIPSVPVGPVTVSSAPTNVVATAGNASAVVNFTLPASTGNSTIISYTVAASPGNITGTGAGSGITVPGLTNGTAYTFTVTATNGVGASAASVASAAVTPFTLPAAPTIGVATATGSGQATVSFTAPANNGSAITLYTVTSTPGNFTATGTTAAPITVTGLTNGTAYTFAVTATNAAGTSAASVASNAVVPVLTTTIASMPYNGTSTIGTQTNYRYTTVGTINQISATAGASGFMSVFTDASYTVLDANWTCTTNCIATTPVPTGTPLYISVTNSTGGAFTLNVANVVIVPSQGAVNAPLAITMPFTTGMVGTTANSYYAYPTVGTINQINSSAASCVGVTPCTTGLDVFTDATYTVPNPNWSCMTGNSCTYIGVAPLAAGTVLYLQEANNSGGAGATYTLSSANVVVNPSAGAAGTPLVIPAMPYTAGMVGTAAHSFYKYTTTVANTGLITANAMTGDIDPQVYLDAAFTMVDTNWACTANIGVTPDTCTATTPVAAGTVLYIKAWNFAAGLGATFTLSSTTVAPPVPASYSISGTVGYAGIKTGSVTVKVASAGNPSFPMWMKHIPAAGAYTVQGLTPGNYVVTAEMDVLNNGAPNASNPRTAAAVATSVAAANVTAVNLTLTDPVAPTPVTPTIQWVSAGNASVMVGATNPTNASGQEIATSYKVYWGTDAATATVGGNFKVVTAPGAQAGGPIYVGGLVNGTTLYFKVSALVGAVESAPSAVMGPKVVGAPTGLNTVTGTVSAPGAIIPAGAAMIVGLFSNTTGVYYTQITNPTTAQAFSIAGVPAGTYNHFAIIDMNGNGVIETGDLSNTNGNAPLVTVAGATTANVTLSSAPSTLSVTTRYDAQWNNYSLNVNSTDGAKRVVGVTMLTGPNVSVPMDTTATNNNQGFVNLTAGAVPVVGDSYSFTVFYSDGTSAAMTANVTGVLGAANAATGLATSAVAVGATAGAPQFSWLAPATPPAGGYTYTLWLSGTAGNTWWMGTMLSTQLSVLYNANAGASAATLTPNLSNTWEVDVNDASGNMAISTRGTY